MCSCMLNVGLNGSVSTSLGMTLPIGSSRTEVDWRDLLINKVVYILKINKLFKTIISSLNNFEEKSSTSGADARSCFV